MDLLAPTSPTERCPSVSNVAIPSVVTTNLPVQPAIVNPGFLDRRRGEESSRGLERRQFGNTYRNLSEPGRELAEAIDAYKLQCRRRYITTDEILEVIYSLGYRKTPRSG